jgi:hypothetical protein
VFLYGFSIRVFPSLGLLHLLFAFALAWSVVGLYFLNRGMRSAVMPEDAGFSTGLAFCRGEIQRQRNLLRRALLWSFGPILLAIGTLILALATIGSPVRGVFPNGLPFLALVVVWIIGYFGVRLRQQRELDRQLDELNDVGNENSR